jgi:hypothetical protein
MSDPTTDRDLPEGHEATARLEPEPAATAPEEPPAGGRHPLQVGYLVAGLLALGFALVWLLSETGVVDQPADDGVGVSLVLITAGLAGLLASLGRSLRRSR